MDKSCPVLSQKRHQTLHGIIVLILGAVCGIAGTAFSVGAEQQRIKNTLNNHDVAIETVKVDNAEYKVSIQKEMDRYVETIMTQMTQLQDHIIQLTITVGNLRTDVHVLKALMERMEEDLKNKSNYN